MTSYTNTGIRLAALLTSTLAFGGLFITAAPAHADYGVINTPTYPSTVCANRYDPNCMVKEWNYLNTTAVQPVSYPYNNTYNTGYQAYSYQPQVYHYTPTYYTPTYNYSNSGNYYNSSYNYSTGAYQYSYQYIEPASSYSYNYEEPQYTTSYDYSNDANNCNSEYDDCYNNSY